MDIERYKKLGIYRKLGSIIWAIYNPKSKQQKEEQKK